LEISSLPECHRHYPGNDFEFLQDSVPSHGAKVTLQQNTVDFIAADEWASYSPDLNPLDCCIWDILQDLVLKADDFRLQIYISKRRSKTSGWSPLRQLENEIHNRKKRLDEVRKQNGGAIQHIFR